MRARLERLAGAIVPSIAGGPRRSRAVWVLAGAVIVWVVVFGILVWRRHERFGSFGFDMGIYDQAVWLVARGHSFITVRGLDVFGHHANLAFYLLAPFSWLGAGPHFLNLLQVVSLAAGSVPLYLLARHRGLSPWIALIPALAWLLHPSLQFLAWELFHPEVVAVAPLLGAYLAATRRHWGWYVVLLVFAVAWKEDVALAAALLGVVVAVRGDRRVGLWTVAASVGWFVFATEVLLTTLNGEGAFYASYYGDLGDSPTAIARNALLHPSRVIEPLVTGEARSYLWHLGAPFGFSFLTAPLTLLLGVPQVLANLLSVHGFTKDFSFHYSALPLAALGLALVESLAWAARRRSALVLRGGAAVVLVAALTTTVLWGPSPVGARYDEGLWPPADDSRLAAKRAAVDAVPAGSAVSATYQFVPHLTHRRQIYEFPNPFCPSNWGLATDAPPDPADVEWLAVDLWLLGQVDRRVLDDLLNEGSFEVVAGGVDRTEDAEVLVARATGVRPSPRCRE